MPAANPSPSAHRLFVLRSVDLAWILVFPLVLQASFALNGGAPTLIFRASSLFWVALAIGEVVLLHGLRREVGPHRAAGALGAALGLAAADLVLAVLSVPPAFDGFDALRLLMGDRGHVLYWGVALAFDVVLWVALERLVDEPASPALRGAFYASRLASAALGALSMLPLDGTRALMNGPLGSIRPWLLAALTLGWSIPQLVLLRRVAQRAPATGDGAPLRPTGQNDLVIGGLWLGGGVLATAVSYSLAAGAGNGRYMITVGPIAYGVVRVVRGLSRQGGR